MPQPQYIVIPHPLSHQYTDNPSTIHSINSEHGIKEVGENAYFVPLSLQEKTKKTSTEVSAVIYIPVSFPESQLFMEDYADRIHLILDEPGMKKYGNSAYLVPQDIYQKEITGFHQEPSVHPEADGEKI